MTDTKQGLGGCLPLFDPRELTPTQKSVDDFIDSKMVPWAKSNGFRPDGRLIGPFNIVLASPEIAASLLDLQASEEKHTSLSERVRQFVILTVGAVWKSNYERYVHSAVAKKIGMLQQTIRALAQGGTGDDLTQE